MSNDKKSVYFNDKLLLLAVFILSGFAGLIYQSVWSQYLGLFLGHAAYAQALVLAIFMGGMAIGALIVARYGENKKDLIKKYAIIEAIIGIFGLLFHFIFNFFVGLSYDTLIPAVESSFMITVIRWGVAGILIIPQTILLGMTFPLMSGGLMRRFPNQDGSLLGGLYFTNSIGAGFGALLSTFLLLPAFGLIGTTIVAGILNILVAIFAYLLARSPEPASQYIVTSNKTNADTLVNSSLLRIVLFGTALSGAASFAYEIIWIRMLSMAVGSTLHAFELMLTSFITGIAFGGLWVRKRADNTQVPLRLVGFMQIGMGLAALFSLLVYANAFEWVGWLMQSLTKTEGGYGLYTFGTAVIAIAIMMPAAFFAGTTLPLFTVALLRNNYGEKAIGQVYACNTLGSIVGVFLTIYFLIPFLGLKLALVLAALVDMGIGVYLLRYQAQNQRDFKMVGVALASVLVATGLAMQVKFDPLKLASGVFRHGDVNMGGNVKILYYKDGKTASISTRLHEHNKVSIATNGKPDASIMMDDKGNPTPDEPTMVLAGVLPLALHDKPENIGVIGFGSGLTTHTFLGDDRVKKVDTIEIEEAMVEGAKIFGHRVERAYNDPRSNIIIDDAKSYFSGQKEKYDIIISEPSNPWISGIGALFATEFYEFIPRHLNDDGLFVQWIQLYEINDELVSSILKGLTTNFSDYRAYVTHADLIIVAKPQGVLQEKESEGIFKGVLAQELRYLDTHNAEHLGLYRVADAKILRAYADLYVTKVNSYYYPYLSLEAPKTRFQGAFARMLSSHLPLQDNMLLEGLGVRVPLDNYEYLLDSHDTNQFKERNKAAWLVRHYLLNPNQELKSNRNLQYASSRHATMLKSIMHNVCQMPQDDLVEEQFADAMLDLTNRTLPYLSTKAQEGVLINPQWLNCEVTQLSPEAQKIFGFLSVLAERDWNKASVLAQDWLQNTPKDSVWRHNFDAWMLNTILINHARNGEWQNLIEAEHQFGNIKNSTHTALVSLLLSMAETEK